MTQFFGHPKPCPSDLIFVFKCPTPDEDAKEVLVVKSEIEDFISQQQFSWKSDSKDLYVCIIDGMVQFFSTEQDNVPEDLNLDSVYSFFGKTIIVADMDEMDIEVAVAELIDDLSLCVIEKTKGATV